VRTSGPGVDTHEMVLIHRVIRREFGQLPRLFRSAANDRARSKVIGAHTREMLDFLHTHHTGEDELLFPLLRERAALDPELMDRMEAEPRIGTCSGKPYFVWPPKPDAEQRFPLTDLSNLVSEKTGDENSVGMTKFYRTACFRQIGGFVRELMWDGIDGHRCRQLGWIAVSWDDPELRFVHLRPMGTSHKNWWTGRVRHGFGQYFMGTTPAYIIASAAYRMTRPPLVLGGLAILYGYFKSMIKRSPRYGDAEFRRFLRRFQWACLVKGKIAATAELNARQARASSRYPPRIKA